MPFLSYEILNNIKVKLPNIKAQEKCRKSFRKNRSKNKIRKKKIQKFKSIKKITIAANVYLKRITLKNVILYFTLFQFF